MQSTTFSQRVGYFGVVVVFSGWFWAREPVSAPLLWGKEGPGEFYSGTESLWSGGYNCSLGCCSLSGSALPVWPGDGACGGWAAVGRLWVMGTVLGMMPSTGGGRPPEARLTTLWGYLRKGKNINGGVSNTCITATAPTVKPSKPLLKSLLNRRLQ